VNTNIKFNKHGGKLFKLTKMDKDKKKYQNDFDKAGRPLRRQQFHQEEIARINRQLEGLQNRYG
jgi:hypothetical protein